MILDALMLKFFIVSILFETDFIFRIRKSNYVLFPKWKFKST